jgi:hypothetical protein
LQSSIVKVAPSFWSDEQLNEIMSDSLFHIALADTGRSAWLDYGFSVTQALLARMLSTCTFESLDTLQHRIGATVGVL